MYVWKNFLFEYFAFFFIFFFKKIKCIRFQTLVPVIFGHFAGQSAVNQAMHFGQSIESGKFRKFHYGKSENLARYGQEEPPNYNLNNVLAPVAVYYSENDWLVVPQDIKQLINALPNVTLDYLLPHAQFNHGDFIYGKDARPFVYDEILKTMKSTE